MKDTFKIVGIEYSIHTPMVYGEDFDIVMTPSEIISASFFVYDKITGGPDHIASRAHARIRSDVYQDITDTIMSFAYTLEEKKPEKKNLFEKIKDKKNKTEELDGGNIFLFALTWSDGVETIRKEYQHPKDRRFLTVIELLEEAVNPQGKKIPRFSYPVIDGVHIFRGEIKDKEYYSYQTTLKDRTHSKERYFFHHYNQDGEHKYESFTITEDEWKKILHIILEYRFDKRPSIKKDAKKGCTIYISDETSRVIEISEKEEKEIIEAFKAIEKR